MSGSFSKKSGRLCNKIFFLFIYNAKSACSCTFSPVAFGALKIVASINVSKSSIPFGLGIFSPSKKNVGVPEIPAFLPDDKSLLTLSLTSLESRSF